MAEPAGRGRRQRPHVALALAFAGALAAWLPPSPAGAETAWVRGEVRLNLRTGPGTQFRILGVAKTGDKIQIRSRGDGWTEVELPDGRRGWIPEGYLEPEPPPTIRLTQLENQVTELSDRLERTTQEATALRQENETLTERDDGQRAEIERLSLEVLELTAGARWPEWITGAGILAVGMLLGAVLHRNATRRPSSRIRI